MGKILSLVLGLAAVAFALHWTLNRPGPVSASSSAAGTEVSQPKRQLDNVRGAAKRIEDEEAKRAQSVLEASE